MKNIWIDWLMQLVSQAPMLLAYLVAIILTMVLWQRCPRAAMFTLIAIVILTLTTLIQSFLFLYLVRMRNELEWTNEKLSWMLSVNGIVASCVRAGAFGLFFAAVFIGRKTAAPSNSQDAF